MEKKFKLKLADDRVIGPFKKDQIEILFKKDVLKGNELCQEFPLGEWRGINHTFNFLKIEKEEGFKEENNQVEYSFQSEEKEIDSTEVFTEFIFSHNNADVPAESPDDNINKMTIDEEFDTSLDKTVIKDESFQKEIEKTFLIKKEIKEESTEKGLKVCTDDPIKKEKEKEKINYDDITQEIDINEIFPEINEELDLNEKSFETKISEEIQEEYEEDYEEEYEEKVSEEELKKEHVKKIVKVGFGIVIIFLILSELFVEEEKKTIETPISVKRPLINFPFQKEFEEPKKSKEFFAKGIESYRKGFYLNKISAANFFNLSVSHKFKNNPAFGNLVMTYAEILPNCKNPKMEGNTLFKLIKLGRNKLFNDVNMVIGTALFYSFFKKKITALNTVENYLRVGKPSLKLLGLYLHLLVKTGKLEKAAKAYKKLLPAKKNWGAEIFLYASEYFDLNQDFKSGEKVLDEGIKKFTSHVSLRLSILKYYLRNKSINYFEKTLGFIRKRDAEHSPVYYASFLENMGLRAILRGNQQKVKAKKDFYFKKSAIYFNKALKIKESPSLRSKLARLAVSGEDVVKELIIKSKIYDFMARSEEAMKKKKWGEALTLGVKAVDLSESFIPPHLLLAKIQIKRGYHASGITRLEDLKELHPKDLKVNHALINAYINSYKLDKAKNELDVLLNKREFQNFVKASEYPALLANYYLKKGDIQSAIKNLNESIKREPLNDENIFKLAKIYLGLRKYPRVRINLSKAIELDPLNVDYKVAWAKILYELESSDLAIGYLRDLLKEHPDDPKILADIAIYYYKSGQLNEFEDQKQKIENMAQADPSFYVFLIKSAEIEEKPEDVIHYANQLLKIYPGNLEIRMLLAELYFKRKEYKKSLNEFKELKEWLPSYPKVNYFLAKGFLAAGNLKKASDYAKEEAELNPSSEYGFVIAGEIFNSEREKTRDRTKILQLARKAIKSFEKAIRLNPRSVEALIGLGKLKLGQGKNNEAVDLFKRANKEDLSFADVYKLLGEAYTARGELGFAIESYKSYLEVNKLAPDKEQIQEMIRKLK